MKGHVLTRASVLMAIASPSAAANRGASFLKEAMQGDNSETTLGSIAAKRGASAGVRDFGQMLARDHRRGKAQAAAVARQMHVPVTNEMAPEAIAERAELARLRGRSFDREFARYMVDDHHKDIAKFSAGGLEQRSRTRSSVGKADFAYAAEASCHCRTSREVAPKARGKALLRRLLAA
jgi:predicted outer membrane protein